LPRPKDDEGPRQGRLSLRLFPLQVMVDKGANQGLEQGHVALCASPPPPSGPSPIPPYSYAADLVAASLGVSVHQQLVLLPWPSRPPSSSSSSSTLPVASLLLEPLASSS